MRLVFKDRKPFWPCKTFLLLACLKSVWVDAQTLLIKGVVVDDSTGAPIRGVQIINPANMHRFYGDSSGNFLIQCHATDTLVFLARGYAVRRLTFPNLPPQQVAEVQVPMKKLWYTLPDVHVVPERSFEQTRRDFSEKTYQRADYVLQGSDVLMHPLTYLYQLLSRRERDRRAHAELVARDQQQNLLVDLLRGYCELGLLTLQEQHLLSFVDFLQRHQLLQFTLTEYEFIQLLQQAQGAYLRNQR
ncbi:MAG: carboxypeptidase-like regulatory domain-containing protein [Chitinophagales bacterium]|nr:carboxypeptidase-like regulatory domain-containing protein [Chitinophagales bacterium]MDW8428427.1 carboxypeptidase-like regulatory domain-containing protein [Chitinophagales bacterium]